MNEHGEGIVVTRKSSNCRSRRSPGLRIFSKAFDDCPLPEGWGLEDVTWDIDHGVLLAHTSLTDSGLPMPLIPETVRGWLGPGLDPRELPRHLRRWIGKRPRPSLPRRRPMMTTTDPTTGKSPTALPTAHLEDPPAGSEQNLQGIDPAPLGNLQQRGGGVRVRQDRPVLFGRRTQRSGPAGTPVTRGSSKVAAQEFTGTAERSVRRFLSKVIGDDFGLWDVIVARGSRDGSRSPRPTSCVVSLPGPVAPCGGSRTRWPRSSTAMRRRIWERQSPAEVLETLTKKLGVGPQPRSRMCILGLLEHGVIRGGGEGDVKVDMHVMRVLGRCTRRHPVQLRRSLACSANARQTHASREVEAGPAALGNRTRMVPCATVPACPSCPLRPECALCKSFGAAAKTNGSSRAAWRSSFQRSRC